MKNFYTLILAFMLIGGSAHTGFSQTVSFNTQILGTGYTPNNGQNGITFVIQNTNPYPAVLNSVANYFGTFGSGTGNFTLWYTSTALSGTSTVSAPAWSPVASVTGVTCSPGMQTTVFPLLAFTIPANTTYRFFLESPSFTLDYVNSGAGVTPNTFTNTGVSLIVGDAVIAGQAVGYGGGPLGLVFTPRSFVGSVGLTLLSSPCVGQPTAGTATALPNNPCPGIPVTLSLTGTTAASGIAYQWQRASSPTGPWTTAGLTAATTNPSFYLPAPGSTTWYRCIVTCTNSGLNDTSNVTGAVVVQPYSISSSCWCIPTYATGGGGDNITNVTLGTLSNNTTAAGNPSPFWVNYIPAQLASTLAIPNLSVAVPATLTINYGTDPSQYGAVWIDWNHNGAFDASEYLSPGTNAGANGTHIITVTPPPTAVSGPTRMRIRAGDDAQMTPSQPCGPTNSVWGEAEDYIVNVLASGPSDPALTGFTAPVGNFCPDSNQTLQAVVCNYGSAPINLAVNPITVTYNVTGPTGLTSYTQVLNTGTLGAFGTGCQNSSVNPVNMFAGGNYSINAVVSGPPGLLNANLNNDSLASAINITNYRPTAGSDYPLCQFGSIPFGQGLTVGGCSSPLSDSATITFTILGPCNDGPNDAASCNFATGILPALIPGSTITGGVLTLSNLATIGISYMSEMRFNVYGSAPTGANIFSPGVQAPGSAATTSPNFTYTRPVSSGQLSNMYTVLSPGAPVNIGYWESYNDVPGGSDININAGGSTVATLKIYYTYVPPAFAWYDVPSSGTSLYSLSPFNPLLFSNAVVNNSNVPGTYTFYAACLGLPTCRVPVNLVINPTPSACQDTMQSCEYAVGANNAVFNLSSMDSFVSCFNSAASVEYYGDQALITLYNGLNDTLSTGIVYSKVFYPATGCFSSDTLALEVVSIPQFSLPIYTGFACAPNAIDISSLINIFPPTQLDTLYFEDPAFTIPYTGNPHSILVADSLYMIVQTTNSAACKDSATAYIDVLPATNSIASQDPGNFSVCGPVGCGNISLSNGTTETLYTTSSCRRIATVTDDPIDGINLGSTTICEDIDCSVQTWPVIGGQPYVNRHYDITPTNNGKAQVCLYYLNQDFLDYDAAAFPAWPSMIPDSTLCITQVDNGALGAAGSTAISIPNAAISTSYDAATTVWTVCFPVDSFSSFYCHTCNLLNTPLPVSLLSFTGKRLDGTSVLNWETSSEQNNSHFVVERSKDAKSFSAVSGKINSKASNGNSSVTLDYTYTDVTPFAGHNYYRLQQNDIDGQQSYSGTVDVYFGNETFITLYPNPVTTELNVEINTPKATTVYVKIMEATGRIVRTIEMSLQAGNNTGKVDLHSLADGVYMVSITNNKGLHYTQTIRKK